MDRPETVAELTETLRAGGYLADRGLATALFVALSLDRPILIEGEVGVGKTEVAKVLAAVFGRRLIRLQCYEGIDTNQALYEWDYARQMLQIRALSERQLDDDGAVDKLFGPKFLLERPLLEAVRAGDRAVLLIDEIDRADDEFEAFLLELLSDFQITIPEIGTIKAESPPLVVLTSNRTRELHDALKRRCLYHWVGYPSPEREVEIVLVRAPGVSETLARKVVAAVNRLRGLELAKPPGVAETIDWVRTLEVLGETELDARTVEDTLGAVVKERDDLELVRANLDGIATRCLRRPARSTRLWSRSPTSCACEGLAVGSGDVLTYCAAMAPLDPTDLLDLYWAGRTTMVTRRDQIPVYDRVFRRFFLDEADALPEPLRLHRAVRGGEPVGAAGARHRARHRGPRRAGGPARPRRLRRGHPAEQGLRRVHARRAGRGPADHGADAAGPAAAPDPAYRAGPGRAPTPDPRRTVRETMRMHGEPSKLFWRQRRLRPRPLVLILDVSGSMADYSRHLLQFAYSATRATTRVEVFCFGTRLTRITRALERRRVDDAHGAGGQRRLRLGGRDPHRARAGHVRPRLGAARPVPGRDRGDLLRRAGPGRPAACWPPRWSGCPGCATGWCG